MVSHANISLQDVDASELSLIHTIVPLADHHHLWAHFLLTMFRPSRPTVEIRPGRFHRLTVIILLVADASRPLPYPPTHWRFASQNQSKVNPRVPNVSRSTRPPSSAVYAPSDSLAPTTFDLTSELIPMNGLSFAQSVARLLHDNTTASDTKVCTRARRSSCARAI